MKSILWLMVALIGCGTQVASGEPTACEMEASALEESICHRFCTFISEADRNKELAAAEEKFMALFQANPTDAGLCLVYGRFSWEYGEQSRALPAFRKAVQLDPSNVSALQALAECYLRDGRLREALDVLKKASALDPSNAQIQFDIGWLFVAIGNELPDSGRDPMVRENVIAAGLRYFKTAVDLEPRNASFAQGFGEAIYALKRPDWRLAMTVWQRVRALNPDRDLANYHLVRTALRLKRQDAADLLLGQIPQPRRDMLSRYLIEEAEKAGVNRSNPDDGPTVLTNSSLPKTN